MEIILKVEEAHYDTLLALLKTLDYVEIIEPVDNNEAIEMYAEEPLTLYQKKSRPSVDEIEQLIIAKALRDAKAIERGELQGKVYDNYKDLITDLENDTDDEISTNYRFQ